MNKISADEPTYSSFVIVDGEEVNVNKVKVLDISEDFFGKDLLDFEYKGKTHQSYIIQRLT